MSKATRQAGLVAEFPAWQDTDGDENISAGKKVRNEHLRFFLIFHKGEKLLNFPIFGTVQLLGIISTEYYAF